MWFPWVRETVSSGDVTSIRRHIHTTFVTLSTWIYDFSFWFLVVFLALSSSRIKACPCSWFPLFGDRAALKLSVAWVSCLGLLNAVSLHPQIILEFIGIVGWIVF